MSKNIKTRFGRFVLLNSYTDRNGFSITLRTARTLANIEVVVRNRQLLAAWYRN